MSQRPKLPDDLQRVLPDAASVLVLTHDNPDPDALASAFTLAEVIEHLLPETSVTVAYAGIIGRAENRAMVRELGLAPEPLTNIDLEEISDIALVDTQPGFGNNSLPTDRTATIVIDHHPRRGGDLEGVAFVDVREGYGATSTILAEYAHQCGVPLSTRLATAIFYAIKSETQELGRDASDPDHEIYMRLFPEADKAALALIQRARVPRDYFRAFQLAIGSAEVYGRTVLSDLRRIENPDIVAEIADFLLRLEGADWACCLGRYNGEVVMSLRTSDPEAHAGRVIRQVVAGLGSAGGHGMSAGGRIPLGEEDYDDVASRVKQRLLESLSSGRRPGEPLVVA